MPRVLSSVIAAALTACCASFGQITITGRLQQERGDGFAPVRDCTVFARSLDRGPLVGEYPDHQGRFVLEFPPDSRVIVGTICPGYRITAVNGRPVPWLTFDCSRPGHCATVELTLEPRAVVEGHVVDQAGLPVERISLELRHDTGGSRIHRHQAVSDDRGYFRFFHLHPGEYELGPVNRGIRQGPTWEGDSQQIALGPGDVESGVQVQMRFVEPMELTGRIRGLPPGTTRVDLTIIGTSEGTGVRTGYGVEVDSEGRFRMPDLRRGRYQILASPQSKPGESDSEAESYIGSVDLESGEVDFARGKPTRLMGTIEVEWPRRDDLPGPVNRDRVSFRLVAEKGLGQHIQTEAPEYTFDIPSLLPGRYTLKFDGPGPRVAKRTRGSQWEPMSEIVLREGSTTKLDLRVRFEVGRLMVLVRPAPEPEDAEQRRPAAHHFVGLRRDGRVTLSPTDQNGRLVFNALQGGDYEICAWRSITREEAAAPEAWQKAGEAVRRFRLEDDVDMEITLTAAP